MKFCFLLCLPLLGCAARSAGRADASRNAAPVVVFAAASLKDVVTEIAGEWSRRSGRRVRLQFEASSTLARQLREGAQADVFITAAPEWLEEVRPLERFDWFSNRLALVVGKDAGDVEVTALDSLAMANAQVPAGTYARAALKYLGIKLPARVIYGSNVRDVLSKVSQGGARAGIVYATDAAIDSHVRIAYTFPIKSHPKIIYAAGLTSPVGRPLYIALREPWALAIARRRGFIDLRQR